MWAVGRRCCCVQGRVGPRADAVGLGGERAVDAGIAPNSLGRWLLLLPLCNHGTGFRRGGVQVGVLVAVAPLRCVCRPAMPLGHGVCISTTHSHN